MKTRIKSTTTIITRDQAEALVAEIADLSIDQREIKNTMDAEILAIKDRHTAELARIGATITERHQIVQSWAQANPDAFGKIKSIQFQCGKVGYRTGTPKLTLLNRTWTWDKVLAAVERVLPAFTRSKAEIDKEAIINQREELAEYLPMIGVKVAQDESFFIEPDLSALPTRITEAA